MRHFLETEVLEKALHGKQICYYGKTVCYHNSFLLILLLNIRILEVLYILMVFYRVIKWTEEVIHETAFHI